MTEYILQVKGSGSACSLITMLNALRDLGQPTCELFSDRWEWLVDVGHGRHGSIIADEKLHGELMLEYVPVEFEKVHEHVPAELSVFSPTAGFHSVLVIGGDSEKLTLVNYDPPDGPVVQEVLWADIDAPKPGNVNRKAFAIRYTGKPGRAIEMCPDCRWSWYQGEEEAHYRCDKDPDKEELDRQAVAADVLNAKFDAGEIDNTTWAREMNALHDWDVEFQSA